MTVQKQIAALQEYIDEWGDGVVIQHVRVSDVIENLQELVQLHCMLDEFEDALRDIYLRVKETGVE